jgi:regulator of cell morphogenesis and NO signaling
MKTSQFSETIGAIAANDCRAGKVFKRIGIDFSYEGNRTLEEASQNVGITVEQLKTALKQVDTFHTPADRKFNCWPLDYLIEYIINVHHRPAKENAIIIYDLAQKVSYQHGENHKDLSKLTSALFLFLHDFLIHLKIEEQVLFPSITQLITKKTYPGAITPLSYFVVRNSMEVLQKEHVAARNDLKLIRTLTKDYALPSDACENFKYLFEKLKEFENDLFQHVHLENNIVFPKAAAVIDKLTE